MLRIKGFLSSFVLFLAFAGIAPDESAVERIKRFATLTKTTADHPESKMLMAELHIAAEDFPAARRALGSLAVDAPTARVLTLLAAIERGEGADDSVVRGWLTKALSAPRGPQWICENCQHIHAGWRATCSNCGSFDTLAWKTPPENEVAMPVGTEMLPLIVGQSAGATRVSSDVVTLEDLPDTPEPPEDAAQK